MEAQAEDVPFPQGESGDQWPESLHDFDALQRVVRFAEGRAEAGRAVAAVSRCFYRQWTLRLGRLFGVEHVLLFTSEVGGEFRSRRCPAVPVRQDLLGRLHRQVQLLEPSRCAQHPPVVSEVPLDAPRDGRRGKGPEWSSPVRVEPVNGLDEGQVGHLLQVLIWRARTPVPARQACGRPEVALDDGVAQTADLGMSGSSAGPCVLAVLGQPNQIRRALRRAADTWWVVLGPAHAAAPRFPWCQHPAHLPFESDVRSATLSPLADRPWG
jgi:hypothetical protein